MALKTATIKFYAYNTNSDRQYCWSELKMPKPDPAYDYYEWGYYATSISVSASDSEKVSTYLPAGVTVISATISGSSPTYTHPTTKKSVSIKSTNIGDFVDVLNTGWRGTITLSASNKRDYPAQGTFEKSPPKPNYYRSLYVECQESATLTITYNDTTMPEQIVHYGTVNGWIDCYAYYGDGGVWHPVEVRYGDNDAWQEIEKRTN